MRKIAFVIAFLGMWALTLLATSQSGRTIQPGENLSALQENQKISLTGRVTAESQGTAQKILTIEKKQKVYCDCPAKTYLNKNVSILGIIDEFNGQKKIIVLRIEEKS